MASFTVPSEFVKSFTPKEVEELKAAFKEFDANGDGNVDASEVKTLLAKLGENVTAAKAEAMVAEVDGDNSGGIDFGELCSMVRDMRMGGKSAFGATLAKSGQRGSVFKITTASGGSHQYSDAERAAFSEHINNCLAGDPHLPYLPLDPASPDLFKCTRDGLLLCKLINKAVPDTVDERALNIKKRDLNIYEINENQNLVINAAKAIGCKVVNIHNEDLISGEKAPHLVLGIIWQIVKCQLLAQISLKEHPELVRLLDEGEELADLLALPPEQILLRWFNFHLKEAGSARRVKNFGGDLKDSENYTTLLAQIAPDRCDKQAMSSADPLERAAHVIRNAKALEVECFIQPGDIASANKRLNMAFCAQIFNTCPGLSITEEELGEFDMAGLDDDDVGDSREERVFRMWINSLGIDDLYVNNLYEDVRGGVVLLQVMDKVQPGLVSWKRVNQKPKNKFKKVENANYCTVLGKEMGFSLVGIGGVDIVAGNKKLILSIVWQLMRCHSLNVLKSLGGGKKVEDRQIVKWANEKVKAKGRTTSMSSFRDPTLGNSVFLMDLLAAIEARAINWELVTTGETEEDRANNAKYVISVARKVGCCVFLTWEDIVEVKPKMIMLFCASLMAFDKTYEQQ